MFWHVKALLSLSLSLSFEEAKSTQFETSCDSNGHLISIFFPPPENTASVSCSRIVIFQVDDDAKVHKLGQRSNLPCPPPFKLVEPQKDLQQLENKSLKKIADSSSLQRAACFAAFIMDLKMP